MKRHLVSAAPIIVTLLVSLAAANAMALGAVRGSDTVLIVPARPSVLKLAFDLENMRDVTIVSFRVPSAPSKGIVLKKQLATESPELLVHVWNGKDWQYVPLNDFGSMAFIEKAPKRVIVIGDDQTVPGALLQNMNWPCKIERLQTMNAADLLNGMNPYFDFSSREWKRLADAYGLKLEDVNAGKRSDIPRSKTPLATHEFKQEKDDAPPAVLIEKPDSLPAKPAGQTSEKPWIK